MLSLKPLSKDHIEIIREWRHGVPETLRTPYFLTKEMQEDYYNEIICNRDSKTRYFEFWDDNKFIGYGGIENIQWENRIGELSVLVNPEHRGQGYGLKCVQSILKQAFDFMNLETVYGECYLSGAYQFWEIVVAKYNAYFTILPKRKYYNGIYYNSLYFSLDRSSIEKD
jgi:RimJ/RimL family protein N-acetyltransferase